MNLPELYEYADHVAGLAEVLIPWSLKGALMLGLAGLGSWILRRSSARARHLAWAVAIAAVLVLPAVQELLPRLPLPAPRADTTETVSRTLVLEPTPLPPRADRDCASAGVATVAKTDASPTTNASAARSQSPAPKLGATPRSGIFGRRLAPLWALLAWVLGAGLVLLRSVPGWRRRRRLAAAATKAPETVTSRVEALCREMGIGRGIRTLLGEAPMPLTWGTFRPVVHLPRAATRWPASRLRHVLLHELAHVARCDALLFRVAEILCAVRWFDPLAWYAAHRLRHEAEHACDERVLEADRRPALYAGHLLESLREARDAHPVAAIALGRRSQLSDRIEGILGDARPRPSRRALLLGSVTSIVLLALIASLSLAAPPEPPEVPAAPPAAEWELPPTEPPSPAEPALSGLPAEPAPPAPARSVLAATPPPGVPDATLAQAAPSALPALPASPAPPASPPPPAPAVPAFSGRVSIHETADGKGGFFDRPAYRGACDGGWLSKGKYGYRVNARDDDWDIRVDHGGCRLEITMRGEVRLGLLDGGVERLGPGARIRIEQTTARGERVLEAVPDGSGVAYQYRVDGRERAFDADARTWLDDVTTEIFRITGIQAEERVAAILAARGVGGVLDETARIGSDNIHRAYLVHLFDQARPTEAETRRALDQAAESIGGDFEMAELLIALAPRADGSTAQGAWLRAAATIGSDFEARRVIEALVGAQRLGPDGLATILGVAQSIGSDFEMAEALLAIERQWPDDLALDTRFFAAVGTIGSDFEARRVLDTITERRMSAHDWDLALEAAGDIGSDFEMAELLVAMARRSPGPLPEAFFAAVDTIGSDFEAQRVLRAAAEDQDLEESELLRLLTAARSIGSDHELAELLVAVARRYAVEGPVRDAFLETSGGVGGSYDRERVLRALEGR